MRLDLILPPCSAAMAVRAELVGEESQQRATVTLSTMVDALMLSRVANDVGLADAMPDESCEEL